MTNQNILDAKFENTYTLVSLQIKLHAQNIDLQKKHSLKYRENFSWFEYASRKLQLKTKVTMLLKEKRFWFERI